MASFLEGLELFEGSLRKVGSRVSDAHFKGRVVDMIPTPYGHHKPGIWGVVTPPQRALGQMLGTRPDAYESTLRVDAQAWVDANYPALAEACSLGHDHPQVDLRSPNPYKAYGSLPLEIISILKEDGGDEIKKRKMVEWIADQKLKPFSFVYMKDEAYVEFLKSAGCTFFTWFLFDFLFTQINTYQAFVRDLSRAVLAGTVKGYVMNAYKVDILAEVLVTAFSWLVIRPLAAYLPFVLLLITTNGLKTGLKSAMRFAAFKLHEGNPHHLNNARDLLIEFTKGVLKGGTRDAYVATMGAAFLSAEAYLCPTLVVALLSLLWSQTLV